MIHKLTRRELLKYGVKAGIIAFGVPTLLKFMETEARAAIALVDNDGTAPTDNNYDVSSFTTAFTGTAGVSLMIVQHVMYDHAQIISGMTYGGVGQDFTMGVQRTTAAGTDNECADIWYKINPATDGTAKNLVVSYLPNRQYEARLKITTWSGTATSLVIGDTDEGYSISGTSPQTLTLTPAAGSMVIDCFGINDNPTQGGNQTLTVNGGVGSTRIVGSYNTTNGTMTYTYANGARFSHVAMEVKASGGAPATAIRRRIIEQ